MATTIPLPSTTEVQITRVVKALYDAAPGNLYLNAFKEYAAENGGVVGVADALLYEHHNKTNADLAQLIVDNLGLAKVDEATGATGANSAADNAKAFLLWQFNVAEQTGATRGQVLVDALNNLATLGSDPIFGKAADFFNASIAQAYSYSVDPANSTYDLAVLEQADEVGVGEGGEVIGQIVGKTFTLTTNPDNIVGTAGNDVVNGYIDTTASSTKSTLAAADVIDGGAGTDSLKLTVEGTSAGALPNASISNVEQFFIRDVATAASSYDFGAIQGEQQVWADTATNAAGVTFSNLGTGATVGIKGNNVLTNLANVSFNMATATDAVSIAIDGGVKNTVAPTITNIAAGAATAATISSTGAANTVGAITLAAAAGNSVKTLTINAATDLTATLTAADFAADATMVVTGAGKVNVGAGFDGATIDASANTGGLTVSTTTTVTKSVTGSSAADAVTLVGSLTSTGKIDLGAGNDKLLAGAGAAIVGTNVIDGGEGTDSISASLINAANAAAIKNFELLDISAATITPLDVELVTGSTITGLTLSGDAGGAATVSNVAAGVGLTIAGTNTGAKTINLKGAATNAADSFAITFDGAKVAGAAATAPNVTAVTGGITLNNVETVSIASGGADNTWNGLLLNGGADNTLQTLTITGAKNLNLDFSAAVGKALTGATDTTNGLKLIDGSAATGKLNIDLTTATTLNTSKEGLTVKGGSNDDIITLKAGVAVAGTNSTKVTVDAGAGNDTIIVDANGGTLTGGAGDDTFDVTLAVATGTTEATAVLTTITDLAAGDKIDFNANATGTFQTTKVTLGAGVTNLDQALAAAIDAANEVAWFQYAGNTYIVADTDAAVGSGTFNAGDTVVKITGLVDLSASTLAGTVLTIA